VWFEQSEETEISVFLDLFASMRVNGARHLFGELGCRAITAAGFE
jgi:hypothetical protein